VYGLGFRVQGSGVLGRMIQDLGLEVWGLESRVLAFRVYGNAKTSALCGLTGGGR
jgi:hypothetical protein